MARRVLAAIKRIRLWRRAYHIAGAGRVLHEAGPEGCAALRRAKAVRRLSRREAEQLLTQGWRMCRRCSAVR